MDLGSHLTRQMVFSKATFGPGDRTLGVLDHISKEIEEVRADYEAGKRTSTEWVDIVILALDGLTRALWAEEPNQTADMIASFAVADIIDKQGKNELREWPDWRQADPDKAIEHKKNPGD